MGLDQLLNEWREQLISLHPLHVGIFQGTIQAYDGKRDNTKGSALFYSSSEFYDYQSSGSCVI